MASFTASHLTSLPNKPKLSFNNADIYVRRVLIKGIWILGFHGDLKRDKHGGAEVTVEIW